MLATSSFKAFPTSIRQSMMPDYFTDQFNYNRKCMKKLRPHRKSSIVWLESILKQKHHLILAVVFFSCFNANASTAINPAGDTTPAEGAASPGNTPNKSTTAPLSPQAENGSLVHNKKSAVLSALQNITVKGKITDETGEPLPGVSIMIAGTKSGTVTNSQGEYQISALEGATLVYTYMGFTTERIPVTNSRMNVTLKVDQVQKQLNEVVVVGYGTQKRSDITGSVTSVPKERLSELPVTNVLQAIEGTTAGLTVNTGSSVPGSSPSVLVRGVNSINASTSPLVVIDGVPFSNLGGSLNDINPNDIASIEILKDASAVAIYGTRGSSGVILVTTKRGKTGKPTVRYSAYAGPEFQNKTLTPLTGEQYVQKYLDYTKQKSLVANNPPVPNQSEIANYNSGITTDWMDEISQQGYIQDHNLSITGGSENVRYFISGEYQKQKGVLKGYQYNRASFRSNLDANVTSWMTIGTSIFFAANNTDGGTVDYSAAMQMSPYGQEYDSKGQYNIYPMFSETLYKNPLLGLNKDIVNRNKNLNGTFYTEIKPLFLKGLKYRLNGNYTYLPTVLDSYGGTNAGNTLGGTASVNNTETNSWLVENILSYDQNWGKHHLDVTALYSAQEKKYKSATVNGSTFVNNDLSFNNINAASLITGATYYSREALISQMGRINYSYNSKYLLTATARRDGYSAFGSSTSKYGVFPSVALGWNVSNEDFLKNVKQIDNLKLRASYGTSGNQAVGVYQTLTTQGITKYIYSGVTTTGLLSSSLGVNGVLGNANLNWESTTGTNLGLDYSLFHSRISGSIEVYKTKTKDLLLKRQIPAVSGYPSIYDNLGSVSNKGIELTLNTANLKTTNFSWSTNFNFAASRNKIVSLYGGNQDDIGNKWFIGKSLRAIYDYKLAGVWQVGEDASKVDPGAKPGDLKFADVNGDGKITEADKTYQGTSLPKWTGGMINNFNYKNFHLSVFLQTSQGSMINNPILNLQDYGGRVNIPQQVGYWTAENGSNTRPALSYVNPKLYAYPVKQNFTRIKDVTASYTLPQQMADKLKLGGLTAYISGRNLHTFTNWVGLDPELNVNANQAGTANADLSYGIYPLVSSYVIGVNLSLR
ncbi:TonB-linked outer membrane protein, SusC/RagA family [Pedobacter hartonius]|uniref:TonB-linked outer membrane protein, SusC/RagA family n=2 Tax=Pedobacter hartonius TaxID=425514 RepID=A0A1H4BL61_9SPHI|nr:TonB-linked outer membrane protein, SusC/RagA family [Pedobacter hartonius]